MTKIGVLPRAIILEVTIASEVLPSSHRKQTLTESKFYLYKITTINCRTTVVLYINILI